MIRSFVIAASSCSSTKTHVSQPSALPGLAHPKRSERARIHHHPMKTYVSERRVNLTQSLHLLAVGRSTVVLEDSLATLDPFRGGGGSEEDLLGLEAAGAGVEDYTMEFG